MSAPSETRVLCAGECMVELAHADAGTLRLGFAGDTYNAAVYLRRVADELGHATEVGYLTGLGEDHYSEEMRAAWAREGVADRSLTVPGRLPGLYTIRTDPDGERQFTYWRGESAARALFADPETWARLDGDLVHLSGITLQLTTRESRAALVARLRELRDAGTRVSFDTNYRPAGWPSAEAAAAAFSELAAVADIVLTGREDEALLHGEAPVEDVLARRAGAAEVVLRDGAAGAHLAAGGEVVHVPARHVEQVVDTTAAGDAFSGAYLAARLAGRPPADAAALAGGVAAVVIGHPGAIAPRDARLVGP